MQQEVVIAQSKGFAKNEKQKSKKNEETIVIPGVRQLNDDISNHSKTQDDRAPDPPEYRNIATHTTASGRIQMMINKVDMLISKDNTEPNQVRNSQLLFANFYNSKENFRTDLSNWQKTHPEWNDSTHSTSVLVRPKTERREKSTNINRTCD